MSTLKRQFQSLETKPFKDRHAAILERSVIENKAFRNGDWKWPRITVTGFFLYYYK